MIRCTLAVLLAASLFAPRSAFAGDDMVPGGTISLISDARWAHMQGRSFDPKIKGCAQRDALRLLTLGYLDFGGRLKFGQMVVHRSVARDVRDVFVQLLKDRSFRIARMDPVDVFDGDDDASMAANNTSGYNCRRASGSARLSSHALGLAIDVNPLLNPYVSRRGTAPKGGEAWDTPEERAAAHSEPGLILSRSAITRAFKAKGWGWGGDWRSSKDYQHFSADGR